VKNKIELKNASKEDAEILANLSKRAFETDIRAGSPFKEGGPPGYDSPQFQLFMMKHLTYQKIFFNGQIVGGVAYNSKKSNHFILERIFIDPQFHNRAIATATMNILFQKYPNIVWTLDTPEWNIRTKHFYEKLGFQQVGWEDMEGDWRCIWYQRDSKGVEIIQKIADLKDGMNEVVVIGDVINVSQSRKVQRKKDGKELTIATALLQDETGQIKLNLWNEQIPKVKLHEKIRIEFGYVNSYNNTLQLNLGFAGRIIKFK